MKSKLFIFVLLFFLWLLSFPLLWSEGTTGRIIQMLLLAGIIHYVTKHPIDIRNPYIIGDSEEIEYLTSDELERRLHGQEKNKKNIK